MPKLINSLFPIDLYPRRWGLGPVALEKKKMKSDGKLDVRSISHFVGLIGEG